MRRWELSLPLWELGLEAAVEGVVGVGTVAAAGGGGGGWGGECACLCS